MRGGDICHCLQNIKNQPYHHQFSPFKNRLIEFSSIGNLETRFSFSHGTKVSRHGRDVKLGVHGPCAARDNRCRSLGASTLSTGKSRSGLPNMVWRDPPHVMTGRVVLPRTEIHLLASRNLPTNPPNPNRSTIVMDDVRRPANVHVQTINTIIRENCRERLFVPPLHWVQRHLDLLDSTFVFDDSIIPAIPAVISPPPTPLLEASETRDSSAPDAPRSRSSTASDTVSAPLSEDDPGHAYFIEAAKRLASGSRDWSRLYGCHRLFDYRGSPLMRQGSVVIYRHDLLLTTLANQRQQGKHTDSIMVRLPHRQHRLWQLLLPKIPGRPGRVAAGSTGAGVSRAHRDSTPAQAQSPAKASPESQMGSQHARVAVIPEATPFSHPAPERARSLHRSRSYRHGPSPEVGGKHGTCLLSGKCLFGCPSFFITGF